MKNSIPVLGTAVVNGVSWLESQIHSIDFPIDLYVVVNNSGKTSVSQELDAVLSHANPNIQRTMKVDLPGNIGCAGAWNLMIKSTMMNPYWVICNHDVSFSPGLLAAVHSNMVSGEVGVLHGSSGDFKVGSWDLFGIADSVIRSHGLFDENFYPAYVEDLDYLMRLLRQPVKRVMLDMPYQHGNGTNRQYDQHGSQSLRADDDLRERVHRARWINENNYMVEKWGKDWRWCITHPRPWNEPSNSVGSWHWQLDFVRDKYTGF